MFRKFLPIFFLLFFISGQPVFSAVLPNDPSYGREWYLKQIQAPEVWEMTTGSPEVVVAVIDSGVDINHPDLKNNIWINAAEIAGDGIDNDKNGYIDDTHGWDFISDAPDPRPKFNEWFNEVGLNHGTMVAGIIAAEGNNGEGIAGVSWKSKIMPLRAIDNLGGGSEENVIEAIDYAIRNGAEIINMSFVGSGADSYFLNALERAREAGVFVAAAAGNDESRDGTGMNLELNPLYPACYDNGKNLVLAAAATDTLDQKAKFSNYGTGCVDLSAPGVAFYGTGVYNPEFGLGSFYLDNWSGTSLATPLVAGAAALLKSLDKNLTAEDLTKLLVLNTDSLGTDSLYAGKLGSGRLNIFRAASKIFSLPKSAASPSTPVISSINSKLAILKTTAVNPKVNIFVDEIFFKSFSVYENFFKGKLNIAVGDLDRNGAMEIISAVASGGGPQIRIFNESGGLLGQFMAYDENFRGGVNVATGDVDGDGKDEIITAPRSAKAPLVRIFKSDGEKIKEFFVFAETFRGGVNLAAGDVDGDGKDEVIAAPESSGGPQVRIFSGEGKLVSQFMAGAENFRGGVKLAAGNLDASGEEEIIASLYPGTPLIKIFNKDGGIKNEFFAFAADFSGEVNLAAGDTDGDGILEIITAPTSSGGPQVRIFNREGVLKSSFFAFSEKDRGGYEALSLK